MLHAFNNKNVRRVLALPGEEHTNDKNEDAITSMVFSPLAFMNSAAALEVLSAVAGASLGSAVDGREPVAHEVELWPARLATSSWSREAESRCEPDLLVRFDFLTGPPVMLIGEMKWDWRVKPDHIIQETERQMSAVGRLAPEACRVLVVITKHRLSDQVPGASQHTWVGIHRAAARLAAGGLAPATRVWGRLVSDFLEKVRQMSFQGFQVPPLSAPLKGRPIFWKA